MKKILKIKKISHLSFIISQLRSELGQTLLEALIALATAVAIISAMTVIVLSSLNNAQFSKNQNQATQYAQQGIEILKNLSQTDWFTFYSTYTLINYCMPADNSLLQKPASPGCAQSLYIINSLFVREVTINKYDALNLDAACLPTSVDRAKITVSVGWSDNKCTTSTDPYCHKAKLVSCIYKSIIPTP